jgi:hypothetical protein
VSKHLVKTPQYQQLSVALQGLVREFEVKDQFPTFADGHQEILLCEAILKSHNEARWIN